MKMVAIFLFLCLACTFSVQAEQSARIVDGWISETLPGVGMSAAYFTVVNDSENGFAIEAASIPDTADVSLHETRVVDGLSKMAAIDKLAIPAKSAVQLKPGGLHLMIRTGDRIFRAEQQIKVSVHLDNGAILEATLPVRPAGSHHHHHH